MSLVAAGRPGHAPPWSWPLDIVALCPVLAAGAGHVPRCGGQTRDMLFRGPHGWACPALRRADPGHALPWSARLDMSPVAAGRPGTCPSLVVAVGHSGIMSSLAAGAGHVPRCG